MHEEKQHENSEFVEHLPCPNPDCGSSDANSLYSDGHQYCFACETYTPPDGGAPVQEKKMSTKREQLIEGEHQELSKRNLTLESCEKWDYMVGRMGDKPVQIANYYDPKGREVVAQKIRWANKDFRFIGEPKEAGLYGQWLWRDGGKMIVITEGEIDAISVSQVQGHKWPVVSVPNGAQGAKKALQKQLDWLEKFETIVLMFDQDEPGWDAAEECAALFSPGKVKIAKLPLKDANELLKDNRVAEIIDAIWAAKPWRPDGLVSFADLKEKVLEEVVIGLPWPWEPLTKATYGRRYGETYALGAGTGVGKTDVFTQIIEFTAVGLNEKCGAIFLEQPVVETARRIAGKLAGKRFHVPDGSWTGEELRNAFAAIEATGNLVLYDHFGSSEWEIIKAKIRYMVSGLGVKHVFLDHLTALAAAAEDERKALEQITAEIAGMAQELNFCFYFISHLATPEGKPHEEGGRVMIRHFKGSRAIGFWSHFMFGLERNQQDDNEERRHLTTFRILKDRYTGQGTGVTFHLRYDAETGLLSVAEDVEQPSPFPNRTEDPEEF